MIREKIENQLKITCLGIDLTEVSHIEFYVKQFKFFGLYIPIVLSSTEMVVTIPFEDAKQLKSGEAELQFAFTDKDGNQDASDLISVKVGELLKESGYDPI